MTSQPAASGGEGPSVSPPPPPPAPPPPPPPVSLPPVAPTLPPPGPTPSLPDRHAEAVAPQVVTRRPEDDPHAIARAAADVARARHDELRQQRRARSAVVVIALLALIAVGVVAVQVLRDDEERADTASDRSPTTTEALDDVLDRLDGASGTASQAPTTVAAGTPDALFGESPDPSLSTAQLVDQLEPARIEPAPALPSFRTRQFVIRRFDGVGTPTVSWQYNHDTTDGRSFLWEVPDGGDAVARYLYFDGTWRHTYALAREMSRSPQRPGVPVIPPAAAYGSPTLADLASFVPPAVAAFAYEVPLPDGVIDRDVRGPASPTQALLIDLAGLRAADPAAADAWLDSFAVQDVDDPALVDTAVIETKQVEPIAISSASALWSIDIGRLHPPPGSALMVVATGADIVSELAVAVPDEGIWFHYYDGIGFDSPLESSIEFGVNGWTPAG